METKNFTDDVVHVREVQQHFVTNIALKMKFNNCLINLKILKC